MAMKKLLSRKKVIPGEGGRRIRARVSAFRDEKSGTTMKALKGVVSDLRKIDL
jgi:hypothetical protein